MSAVRQPHNMVTAAQLQPLCSVNVKLPSPNHMRHILLLKIDGCPTIYLVNGYLVEVIWILMQFQVGASYEFAEKIYAVKADQILRDFCSSTSSWPSFFLNSAARSVWDLGGQERLRTSWATYYRGTHAVIVVIDSTDRARISIMKDELFRLLPQEDLQSSVILVFANKQDLKDAMTPAEITDALSLHSIKNHDWHIQACCALTGEGLYDGLGWISQRVIEKASS
ncbi:unnamed protein product [Ilex paraguariensis]|uniref:ADP-ribosylation factor 1 n=1 Tax=Ilex paraguariensis TaxID=185542 RepID=A0ABC8T6H5_9AQUA